MKHLVRILCFILVTATLLSCVSCKKDTQDEPAYVLSESNVSAYTIVRSEDASDTVISATSKLYSAMSQKFSGIKLKTDMVIEGNADFTESEYEILVGSTNRDESVLVQEQLKKNDYTICLEGKKLIIAGGTDEATVTAIDIFINDFVNAEHKDVFFDSDSTVSFKDSYAAEDLKLNDKHISEYSIIYPKANANRELSLARELQEKIADVTGEVLPIYSDVAHTKDGAEILVGKTNRSSISAYSQTLTEEEYSMGTSEDSVYMFGSGYMFAIGLLMDMIDAQKQEGATHSISVSDSICNVVNNDEAITSMSFNIYYDMSDNNTYGVPDRVSKVTQMILNRMPDTVGCQECTIEWLGTLKTELKQYYGCISGKLSQSGQEYCPIFYRKDKFEVVWSKSQWLSDTPDVQSKVDGAALCRVVTYAKLRRISDGMEFICANTHYDHLNENVGGKQAEIMLELLSEYEGAGLPIVVTGDFNSNPSSPGFKTLNSSYLISSADIGMISKKESTIHCYGNADNILDYVFVTASNIYVYKYEVCTEKIDGYYVSDHHPIISKFIILNN